VTTGKTKTACANTIALRLKSQPKKPNGPERDSIKYTNKPTTTEGKANKVLSTVNTASRPAKRATPNQAPKTKPNAHANVVLRLLTHNERATIDHNKGSKLNKSETAAQALSNKEAMKPFTNTKKSWGIVVVCL